MNDPSIQPQPGWVGVFTRQQAPGAWPNGTRVRKVFGQSGDTHPDDATATVLGSVGDPGLGFGYFVEWDDLPGAAVFVLGNRLGMVA
jgi:hypothetical protein